jgi:hypothetical protein
MTPREPLQRYTPLYTFEEMCGADDGEYYKVADVEAREQAREAGIRELMNLPAHWRSLAESSRTTEIGDRLRFCASALEVELEAIVEPQEGTTP